MKKNTSRPNMEEKPKIIWHYTHSKALDSILSDGILKVSQADKKLIKTATPSLWFSSNQVWEPIATKAVSNRFGERFSLTVEQQYELLGLARIGVNYNESYYTWAKYRHYSGLTYAILDGMEKAGIEMGASPKDWFCSLKNITEEKWVNVQLWDGTKWVDVEEESEEERSVELKKAA